MHMPTVHTQRRCAWWVEAKRTRRHLGDVIVVWSTGRRHDGPQQTKLLVTQRPETVTAREVVDVYVRKCWGELLCKKLKGSVGLGQSQVTNKTGRVERSVVVAIMASLLRLK